MLKEFPIRELLEAAGTDILLTLLLADMSKINSRNVVNYRLTDTSVCVFIVIGYLVFIQVRATK
jgi:hypothetical protein